MKDEQTALANLRKVAEAFLGNWEQHSALQESLAVLGRAISRLDELVQCEKAVDQLTENSGAQ